MNIKKFTYVLLFLLLLVTNLNAKKKMKFTTFTNSGMGQVQQMIIKELYSRLGYEVEILELPGSRALDMSNAGLSDGEVARVPMILKKFKNLIMIPTPLHEIHIAAFVKEENKSFKILNYDDLAKYNVVTMRGYKTVEETFIKKNMKLNVVSNYDQIFLTLNSNRYDVGILTYLDGLNTLKNLKMTNIKVMKPFITNIPVYHFIHKKHKELVPEISKMLKDMKDRGVLKEILQKITKDLENHSIK